MTELSQCFPNLTLEQENYCEWLAQPSSIRIPKTKTEYAGIIGKDRRTLCNWEKALGFEEARLSLIKNWQREDTPQIIDVLKNKALSGDIQAIRTWLEWVEGIENKLKVEHSGNQPIRIIFEDRETKETSTKTGTDPASN
jgi:hypothetical protein